MKKLVALGAAFLAVVVIAAFHLAPMPSEESIKSGFRDKPVYVYADYAESKGPQYLAAAIESRLDRGENVRVLLGSSELSLVEPCSSHPVHFFRDHNYGMTTISVGNAGYQSLWDAIEVGALDNLDAIPGDKLAMVVSMQWFMDGGCTPEAFSHSFSWDAYELCMANSCISEETKEAITRRAISLGVDEDMIYAARDDASFSQRLDYLFMRFLSSGEERRDAALALENNEPVSGACIETDLAIPDWDGWLSFSESEGRASCTNNDLGIYDEYYEQYVIPWMEGLDQADQNAESPYLEWANSELDDFKLFLQVCNEAGVEPLVIVMPVKASYYDYTQYDNDSRQAYYSMIRETCDDYGVEYADFSDHENDTYFMRDVMHFGWTAWVHVNRSMMDFFIEI